MLPARLGAVTSRRRGCRPQRPARGVPEGPTCGGAGRLRSPNAERAPNLPTELAWHSAPLRPDAGFAARDAVARSRLQNCRHALHRVATVRRQDGTKPTSRPSAAAAPMSRSSRRCRCRARWRSSVSVWLDSACVAGQSEPDDRAAVRFGLPPVTRPGSPGCVTKKIMPASPAFFLVAGRAAVTGGAPDFPPVWARSCRLPRTVSAWG